MSFHNALRTNQQISLSPLVLQGLAIRHERAEWLAREQLTGNPRRLPDAAVEADVALLRDKLLSGEVKPNPTYDTAYGTSPGELFMGRVAVHFLTSVYQQMVVSYWTAVEVFAGDLWIAAVNANPASLASLDGAARRIGRSSNEGRSQQKSGTGGGPGVSLADIGKLTQNTYDIKDRMGELLASLFRFQSLPGIREAYSRAFSESEKRARTGTIDAAIGDKSLDALSAVRNLIVHRAGVADQDYVNDQKAAPDAPALEIGAGLKLNAAATVGLVEPAVDCMFRLASAVHGWMRLTGVSDDRWPDPRS